MSRTTILIAAALAATATLAQAQGNGHGRGGPGAVAAQGCPPGLAKKNPPCVPPGLAKKAPSAAPDTGDWSDRDHVRVYAPGDRIHGDDVIVQDPAYYGLDPYYDYYRVGDRFYRVDEDTREVIAFVGALADLLD
ncbi:excinuclease ABC subunit A [Psychromarinibacter sp. C21-152]|uniref:Excinuclease ABC subunit A n=1 Tax=Psychromarinibacter sediminicola TaxID=3033385 RepID=A0AAE3NVH8_9RHOB|nr:excinuclease ABC subunit A [Psychromarinibacter sediminicola]MDF0601397.1 excinuclease ABC subunit A [Psychromarinibacter sediminicola]